MKFQEVVARYLPLVRVPSHISGRNDFGASSLAFGLSGMNSLLRELFTNDFQSSGGCQVSPLTSSMGVDWRRALPTHYLNFILFT